MIIQFEIDDKYKDIVDDLMKNANEISPSDYFATEAHLLIKENLIDYGYSENGTKNTENESLDLCEY